MTLVNADGTLLTKEVYKYEFDSIGNWVKMTTSVAMVANQKIEFEPTEVTYRTIFYYLDASMAKMLQPDTNAAANGKSEQPKSVDAALSTQIRTAASLPARTSFDKIRFSAIQPPTANISTAVDVDAKNNSIPNEAPAPRIIKPLSGGVLNGKALSLPVPTYPEFARRSRVAGKVEVEVVVDESGKVISAQALSGPTSLREAAVEAAKRARFSPTKLSGMPVKMSGSINYNFNLP
jgi:TonB family protein